jgi:conjugal transfer/type IV secretion protein DotA/TraY
MDPAVADMMAAVDAAIAQNATSPATVSQIKDMAGNYTAGTAYGGLYGGGISLSNRASNNSAQFLATTFGVDPENKANALIQLKDVGDYIIGTAETIYVAKKTVDAAQEAKSATPAGAAISAVSTVFGSVISSPKVKFLRALFGGVGDDASDVMKYVFLFAAISMLGFAMTLAFWIPMSPFILWIGGFLGWVIAVLEMVAAAPLWAAAHLHPDGEGMASKYGANGWMIILEVFAKPVLMVVGFFVASRVLDPFYDSHHSFFSTI